jgi:hypothetical protein
VTKFGKGDQVVAARAINRVWSGTYVPEAARGEVVDAPTFGRARVVFAWRSIMGGDQTREVEVDDDEVKKVR